MLQKKYKKDDQLVLTDTKFIYLISIYKIVDNGFSLLESTYYSSKKPLKIIEKDQILKKKEYTLRRFIELEYAPENYLIDNGYEEY